MRVRIVGDRTDIAEHVREGELEELKAEVQLMDGCNPNTVWTWNAIGKRAGAWNLDPKASEAKRGFLLNHVISELLPPREDGYRYANADPVTGQAAWFDLRVRIETDPEPRVPGHRIEPIARNAVR